MADSGTTPDDLIDALRRLETTEAHLRGRLRRRFLVNNADIIALQYIDRAERRGRTVQVTELAPILGLSKPAITALVQRLEHRGHLTKQTDPNNARVRLLVLTDSTRTQLIDALEDSRQRIVAILAETSDIERARTIKLLGRITETLDTGAPLTVPAPEAPLETVT